MAVNRTVLPRKGIIQPRHGDNYETDLDTNWELIDSLLQDAADVQAAVLAAGTVEAWLQDRGLCGVISGFNLSTSTNLTPTLSIGVLYAQGKRYAPASAPNPGPAPANSTTYLWYNSASGFHYTLAESPVTTADAYLGCVITDATRVIEVATATKIYSHLSVTSPVAGNFTLAHHLGRAPLAAVIQMTSGGAIWFQSPTMWNATNLYLVASDASVTAKVLIW
jgi:hypothetical protein